VSAERDALRAVVEKHFRALVAECPSSTILVAQLVLVEGATHVVVAASQAFTEGGPSPDVLRVRFAEVARDYLKLCPRVAWVESSGEPPS
jgi:hypothetical protein